jgi:hypothetical protein
VTGRQGRRRRKLLDNLKERRGYCHLKEEVLDRTMWRARFGRGFGTVERQTNKWMNMMHRKYTAKVIGYILVWLYVYLFILRSVYWISCCPHADQILPVLFMSHNRLCRHSLHWFCRQQVPLKYHYNSTKLHGARSQTKFLFLAMVLGTSKLVNRNISVCNFNRHMFDYVKFIKYNFRIRLVAMLAITKM